MALFFDAQWFDARLAKMGLDRNAMAVSAGIDRTELHRLFTNEREASAAEVNAFAALLGADVVEVSLRCGVANRTPEPGDSPTARIDSIEARLDEIDAWLKDLESKRA